MARYESDFVGTTGGFRRPEGLDPNHGDGYYGMRMRGGRGRAAYGSHRLRHPHDMEGSGGFGGIHGSSGSRMYRGYDRGWERAGGVMSRFDDPRLLHHYNARSQPDGRGYDLQMYRRGERTPVRSWSPPREIRGGYANRGISEAGYSQPWARFPMRGGR